MRWQRVACEYFSTLLPDFYGSNYTLSPSGYLWTDETVGDIAMYIHRRRLIFV
jgi:hypothetical protein